MNSEFFLCSETIKRYLKEILRWMNTTREHVHVENRVLVLPLSSRDDHNHPIFSFSLSLFSLINSHLLCFSHFYNSFIYNSRRIQVYFQDCCLYELFCLVFRSRVSHIQLKRALMIRYLIK